ncbi:MAG: AAA family ATPase [Balneolales bacterium]|nr:AAA family ATPase [Balneolales bacterium]
MQTFKIFYTKPRPAFLSDELRNSFGDLLSLVTTENLESANKEGIQFGQEAFRRDFKRLRTLVEHFAASEDAVFITGEKTVSPSAFIDIFDRVQREEHRILKEKQERDQELKPDGWGYASLDAIIRYLPENQQQLLSRAYWFRFGSFVADGVWKIDKHQILAILRQQAEDKWLHLCPSFDFSVTEGIIKRLPDQIDTNDNANWSVYYTDVVEGSRIIRKASGIIHKLTNATSVEGDSSPKNGATKDPEQKRIKRNIPKVSFGEIGGIDHIVMKVREVIELPLRKPQLFQHLGIKPHKGMMLYGEPGCGKTMIAKAIANEVEAHFISVKGPELINKYQGASEENLRKLFDEARDMQPSIIFFDEMDAVAQRRSSNENLRSDARFVNQLLSVMDGIEDYGRICVIGATNRIELIDSALLRPGRFDYQLEISKPDKEGCRRIFEIVSKNMPFEASVNRSSYGEVLEGLTGADISFIAREAAYNSIRRNLKTDQSFELDALEAFNHEKLTITEEDLMQAKKKVLPE